MNIPQFPVRQLWLVRTQMLGPVLTIMEEVCMPPFRVIPRTGDGAYGVNHNVVPRGIFADEQHEHEDEHGGVDGT